MQPLLSQVSNALSQASDALSRNDAEALETLCAQAVALRSEPLSAAEVGAPERAAYAQALLCFQRQVLAARSNLTLRQRMLAAHAPDFAHVPGATHIPGAAHVPGAALWAR